MACKASGAEAVSFRGMLEIPEDGFDDVELTQNSVYPNWVVSKRLLKAESLGMEPSKMNLRRSDSALVCHISTEASLRQSKTESDATTCGSTYSTRESSVEDVGVDRKQSVPFGDEEEIEKAKHNGIVVALSSLKTEYNSMPRGRADLRANTPSILSIDRTEADNGMRRDRICTDPTTPCMVNLSSLTSDYSTIKRGRAHSDSCCESLFRMPNSRNNQNVLGGDQPQKVESTFRSASCVTTDDSSMRRRTQPEDERIEFMISSKKHNPYQGPPRSRAGSEECSQRTCTVFNSTLPNASAPTMESDTKVTHIASSLCTPSLPQAQASQVGNMSDCLAHLQVEFQQLQEKQRALLEERRRLLAVPSERGSVPSWRRPSPWTSCGLLSHSTEPRSNHVGTVEYCQVSIKPHERTTIIIQNLPSGFARDNLVDLLTSQGFAQKFNFIYAPVKFATMAPVGYAFVNFVSPRAAEECRSKLDGFSDWGPACEDVLSVVWSENDQGLKAVIARHRNSPVMHNSIEERFKPAIYKDGLKVEFPAPTKKIKPPKVSKQRTSVASEDAEGEP